MSSKKAQPESSVGNEEQGWGGTGRLNKRTTRHFSKGNCDNTYLFQSLSSLQTIIVHTNLNIIIIIIIHSFNISYSSTQITVSITLQLK